MARLLSACGFMYPNAPASPESALPASAPRALGAYQLLHPIGQGGAATIYAARHPVHGVVAIKLPDAASAFDAFVDERLDREANLTSRVGHPNVLRTLETGTCSRGRYLVMELLEGDDLETVLERHGPLATEAACEIVRQTLLALEAVHTAGIVHRDLKPTNLVLDSARGQRPDGAAPRVKLIDFGVARSYDGERLTMAGTVVGTPQYLAPEQARGEPADERADLFSLGLIFYELLTARAPFEGLTLHETLSAIVFSNVADVRTARPDVPEDVARVIARALERDPNERFESARRMLDALEHAIARNGLAEGPSDDCLRELARPVTDSHATAIAEAGDAVDMGLQPARDARVEESGAESQGSGIRRLAHHAQRGLGDVAEARRSDSNASNAQAASGARRTTWGRSGSISGFDSVASAAGVDNVAGVENVAGAAGVLAAGALQAGQDVQATQPSGFAFRAHAASPSIAPHELVVYAPWWDPLLVASPFVVGFLACCVIAFGAGIAVHETQRTLGSNPLARVANAVGAGPAATAATATVAAASRAAALKPASDPDAKDYVLQAMVDTRARAASGALLLVPGAREIGGARAAAASVGRRSHNATSRWQRARPSRRWGAHRRR